MNTSLSQRYSLRQQRPLDDFSDSDLRIPQRRRARKHEKILHDIRCPPRLLQDQVRAPARRVVDGMLTQQIADAKNGCERIVQLVRRSRHHLPHRSHLFPLHEVLLDQDRLSDVARRCNNTRDFPGLVE